MFVVVEMSMSFVLLYVNVFFVCAIVAVPTTQNDLVKSFQTAVHQQDLNSILTSIEERLRNLRNVYSMQLSPTLEDKLEQYQRKLDAIDTKIIRLESLVMLNLDKISENISTKNFKDDISKTNLGRKLDAVYEGLSYRLNYIDRKFETTATKIQGKMETTLTRLERMDESLTSRNEEIEIELSDAVAAIDDLKTSYANMEENIVNNTNENFEVSLKEQMLLMQSFNDKSNKVIQTLYENTTKDFNKLEQKIVLELKAVNETDRFLKKFHSELKTELNDYAVKVAEMNSENWKTGSDLKIKLDLLEGILNSTKSEVQNGVRALMVLVGKISNKEHPNLADQAEIEKLNKKIDSNFEKVFSTQNLFIDNCYRLQMDESQIESKISDILEKLIETFEKKTAIEIKDIKNLEKIIKTHDGHITRNLYQANTNLITTFEKMTKDHKNFETNLKQVGDHINALFSLIQDTLADENGLLSSKNANLLLQELEEMEKKMTSLYKQDDILTNSVEEIKEIVSKLHNENSTRVIDEYFKNISDVITGMEAKVNAAYLYYYFNRSKIDAVNRNLTQELQKFIEIINEREDVENKTRNEKIEEMIVEIFGEKAETNETKDDFQTLNNGGQNLLNIIDVRSGIRNESENTTNIGVTSVVTRNEKIEKTIEEIFGKKLKTNETRDDIQTVNNGGQNLLNIIDLRSGIHNESENTTDLSGVTTEINSEDSMELNDSYYDDESESKWQQVLE